MSTRRRSNQNVGTHRVVDWEIAVVKGAARKLDALAAELYAAWDDTQDERYARALAQLQDGCLALSQSATTTAARMRR